jgi:hypothetical protein
VPEIKHHCPKTPFLLVGTQSDKREDHEIIKQVCRVFLALLSDLLLTILIIVVIVILNNILIFIAINIILLLLFLILFFVILLLLLLLLILFYYFIILLLLLFSTNQIDVVRKKKYGVWLGSKIQSKSETKIK